MPLIDLLSRPWPPTPWSGTNLPWGDPEFSERMLAEHLSDSHDLASRSQIHIDRALNWVHETILNREPSRILDLGCGPGLYAKGFAERGHEVFGIDISPASIRHGKSICSGMRVELVEGDWLTAILPGRFDLVALLFSEINGCKREDAIKLLQRAAEVSDKLVLEVQTLEHMLTSDTPGRGWEALTVSPFCAEPHLLLTEHHFDAATLTISTLFTVLNLRTSDIGYVSHTEQGYRDDEWPELLREAGWKLISLGPDLGAPGESRFMTLVATKAF